MGSRLAQRVESLVEGGGPAQWALFLFYPWYGGSSACNLENSKFAGRYLDMKIAFCIEDKFVADNEARI